MKVYRRHLLNNIAVMIFVSVALAVSAEEELETEYSENKTVIEWMKYFIPYFNPPEQKVLEELKKDPKWDMYFNKEPGKQAAENLGRLDVPEVQRGPLKKMDQAPQGTMYVVAVPQNKPLPVDLSLPSEANVIEVLPPGPQERVLAPVPRLSVNPWMGQWIGKYSKLIEYFDPGSSVWNISENSLKDVPIELIFLEDEKLIYKMPKREGVAVYHVQGENIVLECDDVRMRGDYLVKSGGEGQVSFQTSRVLVEDKIRVSIDIQVNSERANISQ